MALKNFVDNETVIDADWLNSVDVVLDTVFEQASTKSEARTNLGLGSAAVVDSPISIANGGTAATDVSTARSNLGLGTIATQDADNVSITGGSVAGITDIAVTDGGTGASTAAAAVANLGVREQLTATRNYYVRTDGSDSNDGLTDSSGGAFLTLQKAYNVATADIDNRGYNVVINIGAGTYTSALVADAPFPGGGTLTFLGDQTTPSNVVISTTSADAISAYGPGVYIILKGMKIQTTTSGDGVLSLNRSQIDLHDVHFGAVAEIQINAREKGLIKINTSYTIAGNAVAHWHATHNGMVYGKETSYTITLTGTPAFSQYFAGGANCGVVVSGPATFSGSATGVRYTFHKNSVCDLSDISGGSETTLPGDTTGVIGTGGRYVIDTTESIADLPNGTSWTPAITFATPGDLSVGYSTQNGFYTKNGKLTTVWFRIQTSSFTHSTASGELRITGLPVTVHDTAPTSHGPIAVYGCTGLVGSGYVLGLLGAADTTYMNIYRWNDTTVPAASTTANYATGTTLLIIGQLSFISKTI